MEIVKLNKYYLASIKEKNLNYPDKGIGLKIYMNDTFFFIPITSKRKLITTRQDEKKFISLGKNGTLLISDYIYIKPFLIEKLVVNNTVESEIIKIKEQKIEILKSLKFQINYSKDRRDLEKKILLSEYISEFTERNKKLAINYTHNAINSMKVLERINFSTEDISAIIDYKVFQKTIDLFDTKTVFNLKDAWEFLIRTLKEPITLDYIISINQLIANHQALKIGNIRDGVNSVGGEFSIECPNKEKIINFLAKTLKSNFDPELKALLIFHKLITEQWFWDGNKRTAFIIANKILIDSGKGVFLLEDSNYDTFSTLLYDCYREKDKRVSLFKFIQESCIKII